MNGTAILSGLIGAGCTGLLAYFVRIRLDRRSVQEAQKRIAYVHLVRISALIAMDTAARIILGVYVGEKIKEFEREKADKFKVSHAICVVIADKLKCFTTEQWKSINTLTFVSGFLKSLIDTIDESKLSAQQLAELPRPAIQQYSQYLSYLSSLRGVVQLWITAIEHENPSLMTADVLHEQWLSVNNFVDSAKILRTALVQSGAATAGEAAALLKTQLEAYHHAFQVRLTNKQMIVAALTDLEKERSAKSG